MSIIWFKKALRAGGVWFVATREKIFMPCPSWQHNAGKSGLLSISKRTQKGTCDNCELRIHSFTDAAARFDLVKSPKELIKLINKIHVAH